MKQFGNDFCFDMNENGEFSLVKPIVQLSIDNEDPCTSKNHINDVSKL